VYRKNGVEEKWREGGLGGRYSEGWVAVFSWAKAHSPFGFAQGKQEWLRHKRGDSRFQRVEKCEEIRVMIRSLLRGDSGQFLF